MADTNSPGTRPVQFVFMSGAAQPLTIQPGDRRFWPVEDAKTLTLQVPRDVGTEDEIRQKFYDWLSRPLALHGDATLERAEHYASQVKVHPSRTAPLCSNCKHVGNATLGDRRLCEHPSVQVDLVVGRSDLFGYQMRGKSQIHAALTTGGLCGPSGRLFEALDKTTG